MMTNNTQVMTEISDSNPVPVDQTSDQSAFQDHVLDISGSELPVVSRTYLASFDLYQSIGIREFLEGSDSIEHKQHNSFLDLLHIKKYGDYTLMKYKKENLNEHNQSTLGMFRSVIFYKDRMVSFCPPKTITINNIPKDKIGSIVDIEDKYAFAQDFVEGTMINVFHTGDNWEIATRSVIGANTKFYQDSVSFREMFFETLEICNMTLDKLNHQYCYSFVLRHPKNRIVSPSPEPMLFLCAAYKINGLTAHEIDVSNDQEIHTMFRMSAIGVPYSYVFQTDAKTYASAIVSPHNGLYTLDDIYVFTQQLGEFYQGVIVRSQDGQTLYKIRNEKYNRLKYLRGNQSKMQYHYYCLRKSGRLHEFQLYFPEYKQQFDQYEQEYNEFISKLYAHYVSRFILKENMDIKSYPYEYRNHMLKLHEQYITSLSTRRQTIKPHIVAWYVANLEPARLMYSINYNKRTHSPPAEMDTTE